MRTSPATSNLFPALFAAKTEIALLPLVKDKQGDKAKYLQLSTLLAAIEPVLALHDLMIVQSCGDDVIVDGLITGVRITTTLVHALSGEWIENSVLIPVQGARKSNKDGGGFAEADAQAGGVSITYGRRYGLFALLSLAVDEDTDGATRTQERRKRAVGVVEKTHARLAELRGRLNDERIVCLCGARLGENHREGCAKAGRPTDPPEPPTPADEGQVPPDPVEGRRSRARPRAGGRNG